MANSLIVPPNDLFKCTALKLFTPLSFPKKPLLRACLFALAFLLTLLGDPVFAQEAPQLNLARTVIQAGMFQIDAQVAQTPQEREIGLMFRREMPAHEGMIFVFERAATQCFWMKNTIMPLTAAFIADDGTIVNLADMKAQSTDSHCSDKEVRFVLEMHQGWFAKRNIKAGYKLGSALFKSNP
jgi:uncharacterized membrane protein (UPF0127 family)